MKKQIERNGHNVELNDSVETSTKFKENFVIYTNILTQLHLDLKNKVITQDQYHTEYKFWTWCCFEEIVGMDFYI